MQAQIEKTAPMRSDVQSTFLPPIERPKGLVMRLLFYFTRRQFGKVLTPVTVFAARMPVAFGQLYGKINSLDKKVTLPKETTVLIRLQVAQTNICHFCIDTARSFVIKESMNQAKFDALKNYRISSLFSDAERAALDYATELTKDRSVAPETFTRASGYYSDRQICEIVWLVASEHVYNLTNIGLNIHSDMLCDIARNKMQKR